MKKVIPIILIVMVVGALLAPTVFSNLKEGLDNLLEDLGNYLEGATSQGEGSSGINAQILYEDGTSEEIATEEGGFMPLTVHYPVSDPRILKSVTFEMWCSFTYDGKLASIFTHSLLKFDVKADGAIERSVNPTQTISQLPSGNILPATTLASITVSSSELETWAGTTGDHSATITGRAYVKVTFLDGQINELETPQDVVATFKFHVETMGATSPLSVTVDVNPLY